MRNIKGISWVFYLISGAKWSKAKRMKLCLFLISMSFTLPAQALNWKLFGACDNHPLLAGQFEADLSKSVGQLSVELFEREGIAYVGSAEGMNSILKSPTGLEAIEVVSDREMRVYGWCFAVNGRSPKLMPHQVFLQKQSDTVVWYQAYSTNKDNEWVDYCTPAYWQKPAQLCSSRP